MFWRSGYANLGIPGYTGNNKALRVLPRRPVDTAPGWTSVVQLSVGVEARGRSLCIDHGWEDVADTVLQWLTANGV